MNDRRKGYDRGYLKGLRYCLEVCFKMVMEADHKWDAHFMVEQIINKINGEIEEYERDEEVSL